MSEKIQYPIGEHARSSIHSANGRPLDEVNLSNLLADQLTPDDLRIHTETLLAQADIARQAGNDRLAENLQRAAELTHVSNQDLLRLYEALRPYRSTFSELITLAENLENEYQAVFVAQFIRQAAQVYKARRLLRKEQKRS